ncbi:MAG: hypothetical protein H0W48_00640 [Methylibium sp.]|nr:hypothetical protein [Methylibium sp.]
MRIRTIKPDFFRHEIVAELEPMTRLFFIGLWCIADVSGRIEDRPRRIKAEVLPYDDADVDALLAELAGKGFLVRYEVAGKRFIEIGGFRKHQRIIGREVDNVSQLPGPPTDATPELPGSHPVDDVAHQGSTGEAPGKDRANRKGERERRKGKEEVEGERAGGFPAPHPELTSDQIASDPGSRWRFERQTTWARVLVPILGSKLGDKLGAKLWPQYRRLVDLYGLNLVEAVAGDQIPDDRWPEKIESALIRAKADLDRRQTIAADADPQLDHSRGLIAEHGWEACLAAIAIPNVPDEATLVVALSGNRALCRKLIAHFDPDSDRAQGAA